MEIRAVLIYRQVPKLSLLGLTLAPGKSSAKVWHWSAKVTGNPMHQSTHSVTPYGIHTASAKEKVAESNFNNINKALVLEFMNCELDSSKLIFNNHSCSNSNAPSANLIGPSFERKGLGALFLGNLGFPCLAQWADGEGDPF